MFADNNDLWEFACRERDNCIDPFTGRYGSRVHHIIPRRFKSVVLFIPNGICLSMEMHKRWHNSERSYIDMIIDKRIITKQRFMLICEVALNADDSTFTSSIYYEKYLTLRG